MTVHLYATKHNRSTELQTNYKQKPERYQNHKSCPLPTDSPYSYKNMLMGKRPFSKCSLVKSVPINKSVYHRTVEALLCFIKPKCLRRC